MKSRTVTISRILLGLIIFASVFLGQFLSQYFESDIVLWVLIAVVDAVVVVSAGAIAKRVEKGLEMEKTAKQVRDVLGRFNMFLSLFSTEKVSKPTIAQLVTMDVVAPQERFAPEIALSIEFPHLPKHQAKALIVYWFGYLWNGANLSQGKDVQYHQCLNDMFESSFEIHKTPESEDFVLGFMRLRNVMEGRAVGRSKLSQVFVGSVDAETYDRTLFEFLERYAKGQAFRYVRRVLERSEDLRSTLVDLISKGRLEAYGVSRDMIARIREKLRREQYHAELFLLVRNKYYSIIPYIKATPVLGGSVSPYNLPVKERLGRHHLSVSIVKPQHRYESTRNFVDVEIKPRIKKGEHGFVGVFPVDSIDSVILPGDADFDEGFVADNYDIVHYLRTGRSETDIDLWNELTKSEIRIEQLLSVIPFNIYVKDITSEEKRCILDNYEAIKGHFGIDKLTDWGEVDSDQLAAKLQTLECMVDLDPERLLSVAQQIVKRAEEDKKSMSRLRLTAFE